MRFASVAAARRILSALGLVTAPEAPDDLTLELGAERARAAIAGACAIAQSRRAAA